MNFRYVLVVMLLMWVMVWSPLMAGGNRPENTDFVYNLLTDKEVVEIDQHHTGSEPGSTKGMIKQAVQPHSTVLLRLHKQ